MILMIDNYDSFTYNLVQYLGQLGEEVAVRRNDEITLVEIEAMKPEAIFLSPGPCSPEQAGITSTCPDVPPKHPHDGGLPRPPGDRPGLRRPGGPGGAGSCTARPPRSSTTAGRSSRGSPAPFPPDATTRSSWSGKPSPTAWRSARRRRKGRSWGSGTEDGPWRGFSSIRNRS